MNTIDIPILVDTKTGARFPLHLPSNARQAKIAKRYIDAQSPTVRAHLRFAVERKTLEAPKVASVYSAFDQTSFAGGLSEATAQDVAEFQMGFNPANSQGL
jgi:hypothetical protein